MTARRRGSVRDLARTIDDCLGDVRCGVQRFTVLAASRGLDASRIAAGGSSAGAHLVLFAALTAPADPTASPGVEVAALVALYPARRAC